MVRTSFRILRQHPHAVGVTLYFGDNIGAVRLSPEEQRLFLDPRVIWASTTNNLERIQLPLFTNREHTNLGSNELRRDEDGVVRRVFPQRVKCLI